MTEEKVCSEDRRGGLRSSVPRGGILVGNSAPQYRGGIAKEQESGFSLETRLLADAVTQLDPMVARIVEKLMNHLGPEQPQTEKSHGEGPMASSPAGLFLYEQRMKINRIIEILGELYDRLEV